MKFNKTIKNNIFFYFWSGLIVLISINSTLAYADTNNTLEHQRSMSIDVPFSAQTFWGTHNSYNSSAYGYPFPNHSQSIKTQLEMGAQIIELDVWNTWDGGFESSSSFPFFKETTNIFLCHGICNYTSDEKFWYILSNQIKPFLENPAYADQVIIFYLEDHAGNNHSKVAKDLNDHIGNYIYKSGGCNKIPTTLTPQDVLDAGKRLVIYKGGSCGSNSSLNALVFDTGSNGIDFIFEAKPTGCGSISPLGTCKDYSPSEIATELETNGKNYVRLDHVSPSGVDVPAVAWSWNNNTNEPSTSVSKRCAVQQAGTNGHYTGGSWRAVDCSEQHYVACIASDGNSWTINANLTADFNGATTLCTANTSGTFSVPVNANQNVKLTNAKDTAGVAEVWININDIDNDGVWNAGHNYNAYTPYIPYTFDEPVSFVLSKGNFVLSTGESITTRNRRLVMQGDGNLVIYKYNYLTKATEGALWATGTNPSSNAKATFQGDGNLVIYSGGNPLWATGTNPNGSVLKLQDDGDLVIYNSSGNALWTSGTNN